MDKGVSRIVSPYSKKDQDRASKEMQRQIARAMDDWYRHWLSVYRYDFTTTVFTRYFGCYPFSMGFHPNPYVKQQMDDYLSNA